ncbi:MAG: hypothetical protein RR408_08785 [Carnobacterium sp.]|uniref:hypothetical protein n=1 Tax=Carnobacterium sp. TaxID=48221 RepID=UPI002FC6DD8C
MIFILLIFSILVISIFKRKKKNQKEELYWQRINQYEKQRKEQILQRAKNQQLIVKKADS